MNYREIMEKEIGRKLGPQEVIHHINGDHSDNRIENLQLCVNQQEHSCIHHGKDLDKWLRECRLGTFKRATKNFSRNKNPFKF